MGQSRGPWILVGVLSAAACGGGGHTNLLAQNGIDASNGNGGGGGQSASGGSSTSGGSGGKGGATASGGAIGTGGVIGGTGGADAGVTPVPEGGVTDAGSGGVTSTGGTTSTGGVTNTGGTTSTGGVTNTGGTTSTGGTSSGGGGGDAAAGGIDCKRFCQRIDDLAAACNSGSPNGNCEDVCNATKDTCQIAKDCFACTGSSPTVTCGDAGRPVLVGCEQKCDHLGDRCGLRPPADAGHGHGADICQSACTAMFAAGCPKSPSFDRCVAFCETAHDTCPKAESCFQCGGPNPVFQCSDTGEPVVPDCADCSDLESQCGDASQ